MKFLLSIFSGIIVAGGLLHGGESRLLDDGLLSNVRSEAARAHPSAVAGIHKVRAAAHEARAVRLWNDPMIGLGFMAADQMMRANDGDVMIGFEQALPKPGMFEAKRRAAEAMGRAETESSEHRPRSPPERRPPAPPSNSRSPMNRSASSRNRSHWLAAMAENARQMTADPMGSGTDALRMETELAKEQQMLDAARRNRVSYAQRLNLTLGRPLETPWPVLKLPVDPPPVPVAAAEVARIPHANPKVRAMREMAAAANAETRMADRERLPEISVGVDAALYSGTGDIRNTTFGVKMSLPWFNENSYQAKIDAAKARETAAGNDVETMRREVAAMVLSAATEAANAAAQARAFSGEIHDRAAKAARTTEAAWISSKAPLADLLDSARVLFGIRLEQRRMIAMQFAALEELQTLVPNR